MNVRIVPIEKEFCSIYDGEGHYEIPKKGPDGLPGIELEASVAKKLVAKYPKMLTWISQEKVEEKTVTRE